MISILWALIAFFSPPPPVFHIEAQELELSQSQKSAQFSGQVTATQGDLAIRCDRLTAHYDEQKGITDLELQGQVELNKGDLRITAGRAQYQASEDLLTLLESPKVSQGQNLIQGEQIRFWPKSGKIQIRKARGQFYAPGIDALQKSLPQIMPSGAPR